MDIGSKILKYQDEIIEDVIRLVRIPSMRGPAEDGKPFGEGPARALDYCLNLGESFGFRVKNEGNYAGHIEYGEGESLLGVLAHVDIVPPGEGWTMQPFGGEMVNGRIYGRGTMDDKGEAVAAIYCLKALRDSGIAPNMRIRVILGAGEETGMEDMEHYFAKQEMPDFAFSPDSEYPICNREKGILRLRVSGKGKAACGIRFDAGTAPNMVPAAAQALVDCGEDFLRRVEREAAAWEKIRVVVQNDGRVCCYGKAAHASDPDRGVNAAAYLNRLLFQAGLPSEKGGLLDFLDACVGLNNYGENLGAACQDADSGKLTLNLGVVHVDEREQTAVLDIRYPVTAKSAPIIRAVTEKASEYGLSVETTEDVPPLYIPADSRLIRKLAEAYKIIMKKEAGVYSTGGGTYARALENRGVAFGAGFRNLSYYNIHAGDEFLVVDEYRKHCEICLQAMYEIACR